MFCNIHNLDFEQKEVEMFGKAILFGICPKCQFESERILLEKEKEQSAREFIGRMENRNIEPLYYSVTLDGFDTSTHELERAPVSHGSEIAGRDAGTAEAGDPTRAGTVIGWSPVIPDTPIFAYTSSMAFLSFASFSGLKFGLSVSRTVCFPVLGSIAIFWTVGRP